MNADAQTEFIERIDRVAHSEGVTEPLPGLRLRRASHPSPMSHGISSRSFCLIAQGSKDIYLGHPASFRPRSQPLFGVDRDAPHLQPDSRGHTRHAIFGVRAHARSGHGRIGDGGIGQTCAAGPCSAHRYRCQPGRCRVIRCGIARAPFDRHTGRCALSRAAAATRDHLPVAHGRTGRPGPADHHAGWGSTGSAQRSTGCAPISTAHAGRCARAGSGDERFRFPSPVQTGDRHEPVAISEAASVAGSAAVDDQRRLRCDHRGLSGWLRRCLTFQPRIQTPLWRTAPARCGPHARHSPNPLRFSPWATQWKTGGYRLRSGCDSRSAGQGSIPALRSDLRTDILAGDAQLIQEVRFAPWRASCPRW